MSNQTGIGEKLKSYLKHPGSFIVMLLVMLGAIITFAVLLFLIAYILINGVPSEREVLDWEQESCVPYLRLYSRRQFLKF